MAWEEELFALFDDLEAQAEALFDAERRAELADRERAEYSTVSLASRLFASTGLAVVLEVRGVGALSGELQRTGDGWCLLRTSRQDWLVPWPAILTAGGISPRSTPEVAWPLVAKLGLGSALRRLAETETPCVVHLHDESRHEGRVGRVGRDFLELVRAVGRPGEALVVPFGAVGAVSSED